jgi:hypothetical protein
MFVVNQVSGMDILLRYERRLPYMFSELIINNIYIRKFINLLMKDGRKYSAFKVFYRLLSFIYLHFSVDPLFIIASLFSNNRIKYDVTVKKIKSNRVLYFPRFLFGPSQLFKSMHFFFSELSNFSIDVDKYYKKVGILLIKCFINPDILRDRISSIYELVFKNRHRLPIITRGAKLGRKSTMYYWSLSKSHFSVDYRRNRRVVKRVYV